MIKLSELKATRAAMTPGRWRGDDSKIEGDVDNEDGPVEIATLGGETMQSDGPGIVATHMAVDALIEIAECDLALEPAKTEAAKARAEFYRTHSSSGRRVVSDAGIRSSIAEIERCERVVLALELRRKVALAKVTP